MTTSGGVISAADLSGIEFPEISYWWGDLLRTKGRLAIIGEPKTAKSFFAIQLSLSMAMGTQFLGMDTKPAVVLYVNFEISMESLQQRLDDLRKELAIPNPDDLLLASPGWLALETSAGKLELEGLIEEAEAARGRLDVLILDPRRQAMGGDENQSEIMTAWCSVLDELRTKRNLAIVIVHHKGKSTTGAGRGSSVFDAWLDTMLWLEPSKSTQWASSYDDGPPDLSQVRLPIRGRDSEQRELCLEFKYPTWHLTDKQAAAELSKVGDAAKCITGIMDSEREMSLSDLRLRAMKAGHTEYAVKGAFKRLVTDAKLEEYQDSGRPGNYKMVRWVSPSK